MNLRRLAWQALRFLRHAAWSSPLARNPFWAGVFVRIGHMYRRSLSLSPSENQVTVVHGSKMMFGTASECYFDMISGTYEPGVTRVLDSLIEPGMVVVDVGAHIGYYTLFAAQKVGPTGKVYAFEPAPSNYDVLMKNVTINGYQNVIPVQKAVCNTQEYSRFFLHTDTVAHSLHSRTLGKAKTSITVEATSLDHFFEKEGWPAVHLVKMDIEGAELDALMGMTKLIERNLAVYLVLEFVPHILRSAGVNPGELLERLKGLGFTIQIIAEDGLRPITDRIAGSPGFSGELLCERDTSTVHNLPAKPKTRLATWSFFSCLPW